MRNGVRIMRVWFPVGRTAFLRIMRRKSQGAILEVGYDLQFVSASAYSDGIVIGFPHRGFATRIAQIVAVVRCI
jgi:hypothetical protein